MQELLGHRDVTTTMIYTHVLNRGGLGVRSPADGLELGGLTGFPDQVAGGTVVQDSRGTGAGPILVVQTREAMHCGRFNSLAVVQVP